MAQRREDIDFKGIKESVSAERVFTWLGLTMKPTPTNADALRGPCPVCQRGGDRALVYTISKKLWSCQGMCKPDAGKNALFGDIIRLVAHVRGIKQPDAAILLRDTFMGEPAKPSPKVGTRRKAAPKKREKVGQPPVGGTEDYSIVDYLTQFGTP